MEEKRAYDKLMEERFSNIHDKMEEKFDNIHEKIDSITNMVTEILKQSKITNGRVNRLESFKSWSVGVAVGVGTVVSVVWSIITFIK